MDFQEVISDDDTTEHTLIVAEQSHVSGTRDGDPEGKPSSLQAKVWLLGAKLVEETHIGKASVHCRLVDFVLGECDDSQKQGDEVDSIYRYSIADCWSLSGPTSCSIIDVWS